jgi:hypothetical protein
VVLKLAHLGAVGVHCFLLDVVCLVSLFHDNNNDPREARFYP